MISLWCWYLRWKNKPPPKKNVRTREDEWFSEGHTGRSSRRSQELDMQSDSRDNTAHSTPLDWRRERSGPIRVPFGEQSRFILTSSWVSWYLPPLSHQFLLLWNSSLMLSVCQMCPVFLLLPQALSIGSQVGICGWFSSEPRQVRRTSPAKLWHLACRFACT